MKLFKRSRGKDISVACPDLLLPSSIHLPALGEEWVVRYNPTSSAKVQARVNGDGSLVVSGNMSDKGAVAKALRRWLAREAKSSLLPWLFELGYTAGLTFRKVIIRGQRSRWGSYSTTGTISLNYRLLFLEPDLVRYVLHHELCHTIHPNHSRSFWTTLEKLEPGCRDLSRKVKKGMDLVPEWAKEN